MPLDCNGVQLLFEPSSSLARSLLFPGFYYVYIYIYIPYSKQPGVLFLIAAYKEIDLLVVTKRLSSHLNLGESLFKIHSPVLAGSQPSPDPGMFLGCPVGS